MALLMIPAAVCACRGRAAAGSSADTSTKAESGTTDAVQYGYTVKKVFPHNASSYTQGLYWHEGYLWEGTGLYGQSALQKTELESGKIVERTPLEERYFGEGIALLGGRIYQLTWQEGEAFVYDAATLERTGGFTYPGEGWGLTTDGEKLYMSDGSDAIFIVNPADFSREGKIDVTLDGRRVRYLNELEWIDGRIWANVYMTDQILIIDPRSGKAEGVVDLEGLLPQAERTPDTDVLNGIAHDAATGRIFVTGKNWSKLFEIELREK